VAGAGASESQKRQSSRILPALEHMPPCGVGHALIDDLVDAPGDLLHRLVKSRSQGRQRGPRGRHVERQGTAEKESWIEVPQDKVGVGHRR
jgi:hypothetical protein